MKKSDAIALLNAKKVRLRINGVGKDFVLLSIIEATELIKELSTAIADVYAAEKEQP